VEIAALAVAVLALLVALAARAKASGATQAIEGAKTEARRRVENLGEELREEIATTRRVLARVAAGGKLTPEQVLEGRLWREVTIDEGRRMLDAGARTLDVRTLPEVARGIIPGALLIPVQEIEERWREVPKDGKPLLVYCAGGERSAAACEFLSRQGYENLANLGGGFTSWTGPTARPS